MHPSKRFLPAALLTTLLFLTCATSMPAALLVYDGFQYGGTGGAINGTSTATATGLTGNYTATFNGPGGSANYTTAGLSFSSNFFATAGGGLALNLAPSSASVNENLTVRATMDFAPTPIVGTVYRSFLVNLSSNVITGGFDSFSTYTHDGSANAMLAAVDSGNSGNNSVVSYRTGTGGAPSTGAPALDTTYLYIAKWTNVGVAGGAEISRTANMWVLTAEGYDQWLSLGGGLEANLATYSAIVASNTDTVQVNLVDGGEFFFNLSEGAAAGTDSMGGVIDELRIGTTLESVAIVPEGHVASLLLAPLAVALLRRRRC